MKMRVCEYCGAKYNDTEPRCPSCGGPNSHPSEEPSAQSAQKAGSKKPATIAELRDFAAAHNLPLNKMRVHIGEDYPHPRAFGIYQAGDGSFVVYKNKADGSRAIRYRGPDEAHAVNELYLKMKELVDQHKAQQLQRTQPRSAASTRSKKRSSFLRDHPWLTFLIILIIFVIIISAAKKSGPQRGYYRFNDDYYYYQGGSWYHYSDLSDSWSVTSTDEELRNNYDDYYQSSGYSYSYGIDDFSGSGYYSNDSDDWDWDDDDDWDWGDDDWEWGDDDWGDSDWGDSDWGDSDWDSDW